MTRTKGIFMSTITTGSTRRSGGFRTASIALGCTVSLLVAACGSPPSSGDGGGRASGEKGGESLADDCPLDALDDATGTVNVDLWYGGLGGSPDAVLQDMAKRFNASQKKVVVTANSQGASYEEMLRKYEGASSTPKQLPQMVYVGDTALGEMVDKGQVLPGGACMEADDYDPKQLDLVARESFSVDGVLYPAYMNVSTPVLYYNKVHFKKAGLDPEKPPTTFAELREMAQALKDAGVSDKPLAFKADEWFFTTWLSGLGLETVDNDNGRNAPPTEAVFDVPDAVDLLTDL
ncbi:MAG: extracellular solute-binding protein, partial [Aquihabitans sp.]